MAGLIETAAAAPLDSLGYSSNRQLPWRTWAALTALLTAEILALTLRFDGGELLRTGGAIAWLLGHANWLLQWTVVTTAAVLLWRGRALLAELRACALAAPYRVGVRSLAVHFAALAVFALLCREVFEGASPTPALALAWVAAGLVTVTAWAMAALPFGVWLRLVQRLGWVLPVAAGIGVLALLLGQFAGTLWQPMSRLTFNAVEVGLRLCGQEVVVRPERFIIGTPAFRVQVAATCSGYESVALVVVFIGLFLWRDRHALRFPNALALLPVAVVVMWWTNVARIVLLILIGSWWWPEAALGGFHSQAGWIGLIGVTLGLIAWASRSRWLLRSEVYAVRVGRATEGEVNLTAAYLAPLMALLAGALITRAFSHNFDLFYPLRVIPPLVALWCYRRAYAPVCWAPSWRPVAIGVAVYGLWLFLSPAPGPEPLGPWYVLSPTLAVGWVIVRVVGAALIVPCVEELAFRGFLMRRLVGSPFERIPLGTFTWLSFVGSSLLFGLLHDRWVAGVVAGMLYAVALYDRRKLADAVVAHGVTNGLLAVHVLATGKWSLWL
jgi:exosortase E/protease (VPEID-CTERM system)